MRESLKGQTKSLGISSLFHYDLRCSIEREQVMQEHDLTREAGISIGGLKGFKKWIKR